MGVKWQITGLDLHFPDGKGYSKLFMSSPGIGISSLEKCSCSSPFFGGGGEFLSFYERFIIECVTELVNHLWSGPPGSRIYNNYDMEGMGLDLTKK